MHPEIGDSSASRGTMKSSAEDGTAGIGIGENVSGEMGVGERVGGGVGGPCCLNLVTDNCTSRG
jgi:hypothetical protein